MWISLVVTLFPLALATAFAIHDLQHRLERWDYRRHAQD